MSPTERHLDRLEPTNARSCVSADRTPTAGALTAGNPQLFEMFAVDQSRSGLAQFESHLPDGVVHVILSDEGPIIRHNSLLANEWGPARPVGCAEWSTFQRNLTRYLIESGRANALEVKRLRSSALTGAKLGDPWIGVAHRILQREAVLPFLDDPSAAQPMDPQIVRLAKEVDAFRKKATENSTLPSATAMVKDVHRRTGEFVRGR